MIKEAEKFKAKICSANWGAGGRSCSCKAGRLKTQEEAMFQVKSKGRNRPMSQLKQSGSRSSSSLPGGQPFRSIQAFN